MMNEDRREARDIYYDFFQMRKLQQLQIQSMAYISMRKGTWGNKNFTAGLLKTDAGRDQLIEDDHGYNELGNLRGSPHALTKLKKDVYAMMRQKGPPTLFLTFSAADSHWTDMLVMLYRTQKGKAISPEEVLELPWATKCELIRADPISVARYYEYRMRHFFDNMVLNCPDLLGRVTDYVWVEEFQKRGTPHRHALVQHVWIEGAPRYHVSSDADYIAFFQRIISCSCDTLLPEFQRLQRHKCSKKYCIRCHGYTCRFVYPWFPIDVATIIKPHDQPTSPDDILLLKAHKKNLETVRKKLAELDEKLSHWEDVNNRCSTNTGKNARKSSSETKEEGSSEEEVNALVHMSFEEFLAACDLDRESYIQALRTSVKREVILFRRDVKDRRINNFNKYLLETNGANMDIQPVLNSYAAVMYLTSYILKGEEGMSLLLKGVCGPSAAGGETIGDKIRSLGRTYLNASEVSAQQAAFLLVGLPLHRCSLVSKYIPCAPRYARTGILKKKLTLSMQPEDSTDIMERSMIDYFLIYHGQRRGDPDLCLADFCCEYQMLPPKSLSKKHKEYCETLLGCDMGDDGCDEEFHADNTLYVVIPPPSWAREDVEPQIKVFRKRMRTCIMRCPPAKKGSEEFYRQRLMLFLPGSMWCDAVGRVVAEGKDSEDIALLGGEEMICDAYGANVAHILPMQSKYVFDEGIDYEEMEKVILQDIAIDREINQGILREGRQEKAVKRTKEKPNQRDMNDVALSYQPGKMKTEEFLDSVDMLTPTQRGVYDHIMHAVEHQGDQFHILLSGGAGVGQSVTLRCITQGIIRSYDRQLGFVAKAKVIVMAATAKAAFNVSGDTIHATLGLVQENIYGGMSDSSKSTKQCDLAHVQVIIIDEISLASANMRHAIHCRCCIIFGTKAEVPFGGKHVVVVGDLFQLPPVDPHYCFERPRIETDPKSELKIIGAPYLWRDIFKLFELTEIMRQKDREFAQRLNRMREGKQTDEDIEFFENIARTRGTPPLLVPRMFFKNVDVDACNQMVMQAMPGTKYVSHAQDTIDGPISGDAIKEAHRTLAGLPPDKTKKVLRRLHLKIGICVEVCANYNKPDGLNNGADGFVQAITADETGNGINIVWVKFSDERVGKRTREAHRHLGDESIQESWTPVFKRTETFNLPKGAKQKGEIKAHRYQFPLKPATARTFHSAQGTSMDAVCMDLCNARRAGMQYTF